MHPSRVAASFNATLRSTSVTFDDGPVLGASRRRLAIANDNRCDSQPHKVLAGLRPSPTSGRRATSPCGAPSLQTSDIRRQMTLPEPEHHAERNLTPWAQVSSPKPPTWRSGYINIPPLKTELLNSPYTQRTRPGTTSKSTPSTGRLGRFSPSKCRRNRRGKPRRSMLSTRKALSWMTAGRFRCRART